jgi:PE family
MSYLVTAPEQVGSAAQNLAGIRSLLAGSAASAAAPTTAVAAAAQDEVSGLVATMFSNFGEEFQTLSAQADAFHEQFVGLMSAGAGAYLSTEAANAGQAMLGAAAPVPGLLGQAPSGAVAGAQAAAADFDVSSVLGGAALIVPPISSVGPSVLNAFSPVINGGVVGLPAIVGGGQLTVPSILTGGLLNLPEALGGGVLGIPSIITGGLLSLPLSVVGGVLTVPPITSVVTSILGGGAVTLPPVLGGGQVSVPSVLTGGVLTLPPIVGGGDVTIPSILTGGLLTLPPVTGGGDVVVPSVVTGGVLTLPPTLGGGQLTVPPVTGDLLGLLGL